MTQNTILVLFLVLGLPASVGLAFLIDWLMTCGNTGGSGWDDI